MGELLSLRQASRDVGQRTIWRNLSFELAAGQRLVIDGPSGSGKTLLLRAVAALDAFTTGSCEFNGRPQAQWSMPIYRSQVMYVPQRAALGAGSVLQALQAPFLLKVHQTRRFDAGVAEALITQLGRPSRLLETPTDDLSGGELQSVLLARALLLEPTILLLDEVTAALDAELARCAEELLVAWSQQRNRALLWVGHDLGSHTRVGTSVFSIQAGAER
jgi:putative ABC transport system ATP-binding protein